MATRLSRSKRLLPQITSDELKRLEEMIVIKSFDCLHENPQSSPVKHSRQHHPKN
jgi:hypothetical protein